jgi:hypothetical protein
MRISSFSVLAFGFGLTVAFTQLSACSNSSEDCNANATCGNAAGTTAHAGTAGQSGGGGSGNDAGASGGGTPSTGGSTNTSGTAGTNGNSGAGGEGGSGPKACTGDVSDDAACWTTNELGVFVSSETGDDAAGDGTQEAPFATIGKGITSAAGKNIYVCLGAVKDTYAEKVSLDATTDAVRIYGGFDCSDWSYSTTRKSSVVSPEVIALRIASLKKGAHIENVRFTAADSNGTDASSYGAFITESKAVILKRVELTAGKGFDGADRAAASKAGDGAMVGAAQNGRPALCGGTPADADGGVWSAPTCGSRGGKGGGAVLNSDGGNGFSGTPSQNVTPANKVNLGTGSTDAQDGTDGTKGSPGDAGSPGISAAGLGSFPIGGFSPADGQDGEVGFPGQGGGGGGASKGSPTCRGASGGAGGMGGCGGPAGKGGSGGGASVGLFSWASEITLTACAIASGTGGAGGDGAKAGAGGVGADGASGGAADVGNGIAKGGRGGSGGNGGNGGSGSGGTGGPSYALVYSGTKPTYDVADTTLTPGKGGAAGVGGQVLTAKAPDGSEGESSPDFQVP